jgi:ABC-type molybdenum transport system ATPase subunit/photorepair protein PhrA
MKYADLLQFDPIQGVVQLKDSRESARAEHLVGTFVISDDMAQRLSELLLPNLALSTHHDCKGTLIVGNYGSGKSHLMAVLSAVSENADLAKKLSHPGVRKAAVAIAGKFKVLRTEIGASEMRLRDILFKTLEKAWMTWASTSHFRRRIKYPRTKPVLKT